MADFLADFVKSACEGACLTGVALAATIGKAQSPQDLPSPNLRHFLFLFHSHSRSLQRCHAQDTWPKNLLPTSVQTRNFSNARTRRHHLSQPFFSSLRSQGTQSVPKAPVAKLLATPPRPPFNKAGIPTSRNCSSKPTPTQQSFL